MIFGGIVPFERRPLAKLTQATVPQLHLPFSRTSTSLCGVDEATLVSAIAAKLGTAACPATEGDEVTGTSIVPAEYIRPAFVVLTKER